MNQATVGTDTFDEFVERARQFHGYPAPGLLLGGFMVEEAKSHIPEGVLFDAIAETAWCLPDAVQMLTPCTVGNGWLKVLNLGIYAVTLYDKSNGIGVRVAVDEKLLSRWSEMHTWLMKTKPKREQDSVLLRQQIAQAGINVCRITPVNVQTQAVARKGKGRIASCPLCNQPYPLDHGRICRFCQGEAPYDITPNPGSAFDGPADLTVLPVDEAVGQAALHDMTRIDPGVEKGPAFTRGQVLSAGDVCRLQQMGKNHIYVERTTAASEGWVHEDDAARAFALGLSGTGVELMGDIREGKANLVAACDGLLQINTDILEAFNMVSGVMAATRHDGLLVKQGARIGATRAIPLYLPESALGQATRILDDSPVLNVLPLRPAQVGILVTGTEVANGLIEDKFEPVISNKLEALGCTAGGTTVVPDDRSAVCEGIQKFIATGCDLIITTAGLSVDPDDVTRQGLVDAGAEDVLYGAPILPGAMTLLAKIGEVQVLGVPACALFYKTTSLDLLLPRLLAGCELNRRDLARLGHGGMCSECKTCTFPKCPFGK
ncbi:FmdE family protein [Desulfovibrio ferrophilus]|uniref:Formylmethanofuran dehydrogenase subunit E region n=1 Tax=Desulfovibrio ferrophilus TaxID=241368 RepID=A0A2Z6AY48_9BACT|nr:FmdE family protein [Desulfovibrio ferrophilus]BBD08076.1 formylmethanofuran dehydrogenase subunit E region [Desulfovibrio ferrophilus]